jgi:hypothetical protein
VKYLLSKGLAKAIYKISIDHLSVSESTECANLTPLPPAEILQMKPALHYYRLHFLECHSTTPYIKTPKFFCKRFTHVAITNNPNDFTI